MERRQAHRQGDWWRCPACRDEFVDVVMEWLDSMARLLLRPAVVAVLILLVGIVWRHAV